MRAILKNIDWMQKDPNDYTGNEDGTVSLTLTLSIGIDGEEGSDYFDLFVCSYDWMKKWYRYPKILTHTLVLHEYNLEEIVNVIESHISKCEGANWEEISAKLSQIFKWEFEDYKDL